MNSRVCKNVQRSVEGVRLSLDLGWVVLSHFTGRSIYLVYLATFFLWMDFFKKTTFTKYSKILGNFSVTKDFTIFAFLQLLSNYRLQRHWCRTPIRTRLWSATPTNLTTIACGPHLTGKLTGPLLNTKSISLIMNLRNITVIIWYVKLPTVCVSRI